MIIERVERVYFGMCRPTRLRTLVNNIWPLKRPEPKRLDRHCIVLGRQLHTAARLHPVSPGGWCATARAPFCASELRSCARARALFCAYEPRLPSCVVNSNRTGAPISINNKIHRVNKSEPLQMLEIIRIHLCIFHIIFSNML